MISITLKKPILWAMTIIALFAATTPSGSEKTMHKAEDTPQPTFNFNQYLVAKPHFTLPFYLFNGHILIDGAVNGRRGKFLFDTATEFPFLLNNHFLSLSKDKLIGQGYATSGQKIVIYTQTRAIANIEIANQIRFKNVPSLPHNDFSFIEQAYTPNFLGMIGHGFNNNYLFMIDYDAQTIEFHGLNQDKAVLASLVDPSRVIATLAFTPTGVDGKMPEIELRMGDITINAFFDTGSAGSLELTESMKKTLEDRGNLILTAREHSYGSYETHVSATLKGISYGTQDLHDASNLTFKIGKQNLLGLGYHFLKNYISVWDYKHHTLTLLKPS